jgi:hypothetical protein
MKYKFFPLFLLVLLTSFTNLPSKSDSVLITTAIEDNSLSKTASIYKRLNANSCSMPSLECFTTAMDGYNLLRNKGLVQKNILTLVDFSLSSNTKRLWVIDLDKNIVLYNTLVAHGRNTGEEFASDFSNQAESFKSSIGFYATGEIYNGKHGLSLKLDGLEKGLNDKARERAVVIHGADYVSESFIRQNKRLGRSQGCPAIPVEMNSKIINVIKDKSCLFLYHPSKSREIISKLNA